MLSVLILMTFTVIIDKMIICCDNQPILYCLLRLDTVTLLDIWSDTTWCQNKLHMYISQQDYNQPNYTRMN